MPQRGGVDLSMFAVLTISPAVNFRLLLLPLDGECISALLRRSEERGQVGRPVEVAGDPVLDFPPRLLVAVQVFFFLLICLGKCRILIHILNLPTFII